MVGENTPAYSVPRILNENTEQVILTGSVLCQDGTSREVELTAKNIDLSDGSAELVVKFAQDNDQEHTLAGRFLEVSGRSFVIHSNTPVTVEYTKDNTKVKHTLLFNSSATPSFFAYAGDPVAGEVELNPHLFSICHLAWTGEDADTVKSPQSVEFKTLQIQEKANP